MIRIDYKNPRALFEQVRDGIRDLIVNGVLQVDERIPSVRELAQELSINPNTIQKAYRELEREGYIYQVSGKGSFVAPAERSRNPEKQSQLLEQWQNIARELLYMGVSRQTLLEALETTAARLNPKEQVQA